jgi:hypothetical protein
VAFAQVVRPICRADNHCRVPGRDVVEDSVEEGVLGLALLAGKRGV